MPFRLFSDWGKILDSPVEDQRKCWPYETKRTKFGRNLIATNRWPLFISLRFPIRFSFLTILDKALRTKPEKSLRVLVVNAGWIGNVAQFYL
ncbi:MAG: hypothetical protein ABIQ35_00560 [Verrucomicrobiota bacterium]